MQIYCIRFKIKKMEDFAMAETVTKLPIKMGEKLSPSSTMQASSPFSTLRREIDRLFDDFGGGFWRSPFRSAFALEPFSQREMTWASSPAVDVAETEKTYEITAELPGMDEKNIEVKVSNGNLTITGEKQEEKEEKEKDYYLKERHFGSFERSFQIPEGVDPSKIEATFKKGVLKVTLPKKVEALKTDKKIEIKAA
jgi:HSP20 family protein